MWLSLSRGNKTRYTLVNRQSVWPAPDGSDAELVINTCADLEQEVVLVTPRVVRLRYRIDSIAATMAIEPQTPAPWPAADPIVGRSFEVMLTEKGALMVPAQGDRLENRVAVWLSMLAEDVRCSWPMPPDDIAAGSAWHMGPTLPGGLPPGTTSASFDVSYRVDELNGTRASIGVAFRMRLVLESARAVTGEGHGNMTIQVDRGAGIESATRTSALELVGGRQGARRHELLRSNVELKRL